MVKVYSGIREAKQIFFCLRSEFGEDVELLSQLNQLLPKVENFVKMIDETVDFDAYDEDKSYKVKASFDENLGELREQLDTIKDEIKSLPSKEARSLGIAETSLKLESAPAQNGYYFRVTLKDEKHLRSNKKVTIIDSAKSGVKFRTPNLERLNSEYRDLERAYEAQQQSVIDEVVGVAHGYHGHVRDLGLVVSEIDCFVSLAVAADSAPTPYVKPTLNDEGRLDLTKG